MFSNKLILILTFTLIVFLIVAVNNVENVKTGQTYVQTPSEYCSSERLPKPSSNALASLSDIGLGVPPPKESTQNNSSDHHGMTSLKNPDASSSTDYCLNDTAEEYVKIDEKKKKKKKKVT